jgi:hypothetical protein
VSFSLSNYNFKRQSSPTKSLSSMFPFLPPFFILTSLGILCFYNGHAFFRNTRLISRYESPFPAPAKNNNPFLQVTQELLPKRAVPHPDRPNPTLPTCLRLPILSLHPTSASVLLPAAPQRFSQISRPASSTHETRSRTPRLSFACPSGPWQVLLGRQKT